MNVISLEYHETLMAGSGLQAQAALAEAVTKYSGKYICVVEGSIPTRDKGVYMKLAGRPAMEVLADVGGKAAAIVAIGPAQRGEAFHRNHKTVNGQRFDHRQTNKQMPAVAIDTTATTVTLSIRDPLWSMLLPLEAEPVAHSAAPQF